MNTTRAAPTRRKRGADENLFLPPEPLGSQDTPFKRRRQLLRGVRSHRSISANLYKIIESILDRILVSSTSLIGFDSIESTAKRTGLCERSVAFAFAEMKVLGLGVRLPASRLRAWLDAFGLDHGFAFPDDASPHAWFTILLIHLPEDLANRARLCAIEGGSDRARLFTPVAQDCALAVAQDCAPVLPIWNWSLSESSPLNREGDGSLDPGGEADMQEAPPGNDAEAKHGLEELTADPNPIVARLARAGLARLGSSPSSPPAEPIRTPAMTPAPADLPLTPVMEPIAITGPSGTLGDLDVRALAGRVAASTAVPTAPGEARSRPIDPGSRIWEHVHDLPDAPPAKVAAVVRALMARFRDWNPLTELTYLKYLGRVRTCEFPAELVAGLVKDACEPGVRKPARHLSKALADEWNRMKSRPPGVPGKSPGDRP
jgi:hypothetical protein